MHYVGHGPVDWWVTYCHRLRVTEFDPLSAILGISKVCTQLLQLVTLLRQQLARCCFASCLQQSGKTVIGSKYHTIPYHPGRCGVDCHVQRWSQFSGGPLHMPAGMEGSVSRCEWCVDTTILLAVRISSVCKGRTGEFKGLLFNKLGLQYVWFLWGCVLLTVPASSVIPTLAQTGGSGGFKLGSSGLSQTWEHTGVPCVSAWNINLLICTD